MRALLQKTLYSGNVRLYHLLALVYLLLSIYYAKERILNTDCSYQIFTSINTKGFFFQEGRYGMFPTQILLVLGILFKAPILALIHLYSLSFPLVYLSVLFVNHSVFKSKEASLATILSLVIGSGATFYHATTETHLLVALGCLLFGAFSARDRLGSRTLSYFIWAMIITWSLFVHPNAIFTIFFASGLSFFLKRIKLREWFAIVLFCGMFLLIKTLLAPADSYDSKQFSRLVGWMEVLPGFFDLWPVQFIKLRLWNQYAGVLILLAALLLGCRKGPVLLFLFMAMTGFLLLTIFTFAPGDSNAMMEKSFMPVIFMVVLVFSVLYYQMRNTWPLTLLIIALSIHSFSVIIENGVPYQNRLNAIAMLLEIEGRDHPKLIADVADLDERTFRFSWWATSLDALMLSKCIGDDPKTLFLTERIQDPSIDTLATDRFLYLPWSINGLSLNDPDYFDLPEVPYHRVTHFEQ